MTAFAFERSRAAPHSRAGGRLRSAARELNEPLLENTSEGVGGYAVHRGLHPAIRHSYGVTSAAIIGNAQRCDARTQGKHQRGQQ